MPARPLYGSDDAAYCPGWQSRAAFKTQEKEPDIWFAGWVPRAKTLTSPQVARHTEQSMNKGSASPDAATSLSPARAWALMIVQQARECRDGDPGLEGLISQIIQGYKGVEPLEEKALPPLPDRASEIWRERDKSQRETIFDFIRRLYQPWIDNGAMTQADLKKIDSSAHAALVNACSYKGILPSTIVPPAIPVGQYDDAYDREIIANSNDPYERHLARSRILHRSKRRDPSDQDGSREAT